MFRRTFLSLSALRLFSGTAIASPQTSVDLLIVGAGASGLAAACRAVELGIKKVLIIEKEPLIGGSSIRCGGHWSVSQTEYQRSLNIKDKDEWFFSDLMEAGQWKNDPWLVKVFIEKGREEYEFLNSLGVQPFSLWASGGSGVPRGHVFDPHKLVRTLLTFAIDHGVKVLTGVKAQRLLMDNSQSITGVEIKRLGGTEPIKTKCVLLASGGFGNNRKMLERYVSDLENVQVFSGNGNTGDGHQMAMALGAELIDTEYIKPSYGFIRNAADANDFSMIFYSGAVILNQNGERFVNESMSYKDIGPIALVQPNGRSYIVFDENIRLMQLQNRPPETRLFGNITQDSKHIYFAEDLSEAARRAGLNPENTVRTIQNYNQSIKTGKEVSFKRLSLSGAFGTPVPIEKAPFYIMPATCGIMGTYCGIRVNAKTQVLIQGKHPVKNLLAAGEIMGGRSRCQLYARLWFWKGSGIRKSSRGNSGRSACNMIRTFLILLIALCFGGKVWCAQTLRIGIQETILQGQEKELIYETISSLKLKLNRNIEVCEFSSKDLQKAIQNNEVDLFISSTPFFIAEAKSGARDIATLVSDRAFDPNQGLSALILVKEGSNGLNSLADLKDKTVVFNPRYGQETVYLVKGELEQSGKDSSFILNKLTARDESVKELLDDLSQEKLDAVVLPSCLLEEEAEKNEINTLNLRVLNEKNHPNLLCLHSTSLYPSTTFAMLPSVQAELSRKLRLILLGQEAIKGGMYWGTSSDYDSVDRLLRSLDMDAYASDRKWTLKNVVNKYWYIFVGFLLLILGLMAHSVRTEALVKKRTAQLQASLKQREKLQVQAAKSEEALGKLQRLGTVSQISSLFAHELRQPLNAIRCYAYSLLKQTMKAGSNLDKEKFASGLEEINEQAQRADEIIQKVRDYVKDKSRDLTQVDLDQILRKTIESFSLGHPECEIQVQTIPAKVLGDPLEIELIISNLIKNAYEASVGKKTEPQVYLKGERKSGNFQIEVWDNGPQLSEEQLSEISNSSGSTKADGLGLGLSIVKTFVERHGGTLIYSRSPLGGLLVSFNLRLVNGEKGNGS